MGEEYSARERLEIEYNNAKNSIVWAEEKISECREEIGESMRLISRLEAAMEAYDKE